MVEEIIRDEAEEFYEYGDWKRYNSTPKGLKDGLESELFNHNQSSAKLIYLYEVLRLIREKYHDHLRYCKYKDEPLKCQENKEYIKQIYYVEQLISNLNPEFDFQILRPQVNADLIHENLKKLSDYPDAAKLYQGALDKLNEGLNERNLLDDLRLSYEVLLKQILSNDKSLENQTSELGKYLKEQEYPSEQLRLISGFSSFAGLD